MDLLQSIAAVFRRLASSLSTFEKTAAREPEPRQKAARLGKEGEKRAATFLRKAGYKILARNLKTRSGGEVDLVCRLPALPELVFVEVKTRSSNRHGSPGDAVDTKKRERIIQSAREWLHLLEEESPSRTCTPEDACAKSPPQVSVRFDVVEVLHEEGEWSITHLAGAFLAEEPLHPGSVPSSRGATQGGARPKHAHADGAPFRRHRGRG